MGYFITFMFLVQMLQCIHFAHENMEKKLKIAENSSSALTAQSGKQ